MYELLEETLGIHFQNPAFLKLALTHSSYIYETPGTGLASNERLEFLGDSILTFISADFLYRTFPELSEGELTDVRAALVKTETLATFARDLALGNFLLMGKGEQNTGGGQRVLAAVFEAVLGAIYLDQGIDSRQCLRRYWEPFILTRGLRQRSASCSADWNPLHMKLSRSGRLKIINLSSRNLHRRMMASRHLIAWPARKVHRIIASSQSR